MATTVDPRVRELASRIARVEGQIKGLSLSSRLVNSALENGAIREYDLDGDLTGLYGKLPDGSHGSYIFKGPPPAIPDMPTVIGGPASVTAIWGGTFEGNASTPMDFSHVEVYAAPEPFQFIEEAELVGTIVGEDGDRITFGRTKGTWHVGLVTVTKAGRRSSVSQTASAESASVLDSTVVDEMNERIGDAETAIDGANAWISTTGTQLDTRLGEAETDLNTLYDTTIPNLTNRLGQAETDIGTASTWISTTGSELDRRLREIEENPPGLSEAAWTVSDRAPLAADGTGKVVNWVWQRVDADGNQTGFWHWDGANWVSHGLAASFLPVVNIGEGTAGSLDIGRLSATEGTFSTAVIDEAYAKIVRSRRITTDMLVVGQGDNLIADPYFVDDTVKAIRKKYQVGFATGTDYGFSTAEQLNFFGGGGQPATGTKNFYLYGADYADYSGGSNAAEALIPVEGGDVFRLRARVYCVGGGARFAYRYRRKDGTTGYTTAGQSVPGFSAAGLRTIETLLTVPADVTHIIPAVQFDTPVTQGNVYGGVSMVRANDASLIVEGAINAEHIVASEAVWTKVLGTHKITALEADLGTFAADSGFVNDLRGNMLTVGSVPPSALGNGALSSGSALKTGTGTTRVEISPSGITAFSANVATVTISGADGSLTATKGTITGATLRTAASGQRVQMDSAGLHGYNPNGTSYLDVNPANGGTMEFTVRSGYEPASGTWFPAGTLKFVQSVRGRLAGIGWTSGTTPDFLVGMPPTGTEAGTPQNAAGMAVQPTSAKLHGGGAFGAYVQAFGEGHSANPGLLRLSSGSATTWNIDMVGDNTRIIGGTLTLDSGNLAGVTQTAGGSGITLLSELRIKSNHTTTTLAANAYLAGDNRLAKTTSARRFKDAIQPVEATQDPAALLQVNPVTWFDHNTAVAYAEYLERVEAFGPDPDPAELEGLDELRRIPGVIAEDVEAAGLTAFVTYSTDPETGERVVQQVAYDRLWTLLIPLVRELRERVAALEGAQ